MIHMKVFWPLDYKLQIQTTAVFSLICTKKKIFNWISYQHFTTRRIYQKNQDFHSSWKIKWSGHGVQTQCLHLYMAKTGWCWITAVPLKCGKKSSACHSPLQSLLIPNMEVEYPLSCFILYLPWMLSAWSTWAHVDLQSSFRFYFCFWFQLSNGLIDHQSTY